MTKLKIGVIAAMITISCGHNHNPATGEEAHVHNETLQLFSYNSDFEIFAAATPFVKGQESEILAHFTFLDTFKPLSTGKINATLIVGTERITQTREQPDRPGIYLFRITPTTTGNGRIVFDIETPKGSSQITLPDIVVYTGVHKAHEEAAKAAITSSNGVSFTKEQSWKVDFATAEARCEPFGQVIRTVAQIVPSQGDERIISAKTNGTVYFDVNITEGQSVASGQTLLTIDGSATADNNLAVRYAQAESEYNRAKAEYDRKTELAKEHIVSQGDLLQAKTDFANAEVNFNHLKRNFSAGKERVGAPIGGFVTRVWVQNGQFVESGQPLLVVSQNRNLLLKAEVPPRYYHLLPHITTANIRELYNNRTYTLDQLDGRFLSYGKTTDIDHPLISVLFQIKNQAGLLAGSFVEMYIKTQTQAQAVTIPSGSIFEEMGNYFVFVQLTPELFEKRTVTTGVTDGMFIEIKAGVAAGERVVSKGAILVKLAQSSGALDPHAGHVH